MAGDCYRDSSVITSNFKKPKIIQKYLDAYLKFKVCKFVGSIINIEHYNLPLVGFLSICSLD